VHPGDKTIQIYIAVNLHTLPFVKSFALSNYDAFVTFAQHTALLEEEALFERAE
jgi:hypothetical protein